jgi:hypothetical protein
MNGPSTDSATGANGRELHLDRLLGRQVFGGNNQSVGRLQEFRAEKQGRDWAIVEYVIGAAGLFERLGVGVRLLVGKPGRGYVARWDQLDISDPERPRLTCGVEALRRV